MKIRLKCLVAFCVSAVVTTAAVWPTAAMAFERRVNAASLCSPYGDTANPNWSRYDNGLWNEGSGSSWAVCGLPNDTNLNLANATQVNIHGRDGTAAATVTAQACATYYGSNGGKCGPLVDDSTTASWTGDYVITLKGASLSPWTGQGEDLRMTSVAMTGSHLPNCTHTLTSPGRDRTLSGHGDRSRREVHAD